MEKLSRIRRAMQDTGREAILLTDEVNARYATGFSFTDGCVLITQKSAHLVTDSRYTEEAKANVSSAFLVVAPESRVFYVTEVLAGEGIRELYYEDLSLSCAAYRRMSEMYSVPLMPLGDMMQTLRMKKDKDELAAIAEAQSLTDRAYSHLLEVMTPSMTEIEVALELEFFMRRHGAEGVSFDTISVSGALSSLPHGRGMARPLQRGFLTVDFGAKVKGYCADMTRTVCIGRADDEMKRLYGTVLAAQEAGLSAIRAGASCRGVDNAARSLIEGAGYHGAFGHGLGHGVGMEVHEKPRLSPMAANERLEAGMVVTVEPGIYLEGRYGCRIEDMVAVTEDGYENFTQSSKEFVELFT